MAKYRITIKKSAAKELEAIPKKDLPRIIKRIQTLAQNPRPDGSQKLSGKEQYRVRQGDYRIVYSIEDKDRIIDIFKIGHRREVYRL
ncbi:MAG: type II toxin-antitoxin system mRNA interferase toxin, RelE/StbE family [Phycisphaerae bacterium]|nr:type II toxin-antitoxin system RelE/ParE family toxin [Phycisphaerae bacterium]NIP53318.1 type II toxin-antitoxin system RelE/ParE family toxin [Phycisphaerae bacterium]NIS49953.1 type II toxin-antitoxin system RelE/ParE family toxin [Phycisphaerae bacterium]NIU07657.1 type II toxin-antitoxin system RelE/ParE family toxin [Phycisphaerae bacterium]NIU57522.1 type II toxin-antitoxin system mRNA interferase toxin, RelE/StbE family [Phycisphaerae bacterium]